MIFLHEALTELVVVANAVPILSGISVLGHSNLSHRRADLHTVGDRYINLSELVKDRSGELLFRASCPSFKTSSLTTFN